MRLSRTCFAARPVSQMILGLVLAAGLAASPAVAQPGGGGGGGGMRMMMGGGGGMFGSGAPLSTDEIARIAKVVGFNAEQGEAAKALMEGYLPEYQKKADEQTKFMEDLREQFRDTRDPSVWQDAAPKMQAFRTYRDDWRKKVLADVQALATPEQAANWPKVDRMLRRDSMRNAFGPSLSGERVDVIKLVEDLKLPAEKMTDVQPILDAYDVELDRDLAKRIELRDSAMGAGADAFRNGDMAKMEEMLKENREAAIKVRDVSRKYARQIEGVLDDASKAKFTAAFKQQSFPQIYRSRYGDQALTAAIAMTELEQSQRDAVTALMETYTRDTAQLNERSEKATEENEATMTVAGMMGGFGGGGGGGGNEAMRELREQRRTLENGTLDKLKAILTPEQFAKLPERRDDNGGPGGGGQGGGRQRGGNMDGGNGGNGGGGNGGGGGGNRRPRGNPPAQPAQPAPRGV